MVLIFSLPVLVLEECIKYIGRRQLKFKQYAHQLKTQSMKDLKEFADGIRHGPMVPSPMF